MNVVFRVDASNQIGSGHVMRCLTLADLFKKSGSNINFITRNHVGNLDSLIESRGYEIYTLPKIEKIKAQKLTGYLKWLGVLQSEDARQSVQKIRNDIIDLLVVDHYALDIEWESILRSQVKSILVIDDLANRKHDCDWLLDQNLFSNRERYDYLVSNKTIKIFGPKYALVNEDFLKYRKNVSKIQSIKRIFIFFGGSDLFNLTMMTLKSLKHPKFKKLELVVVIGAGNPYASEIKKFVSNIDNAVLHIQVKNMAELMSSSDISIGSGGSATWERFAIGLPCLVVTFGRDQELVIKELVKNNYTTWLGNVKQVNQSVISNATLKMIDNPKELYEKQIKSQKLVDGMGAKRVFKIINLSKNSLNLVPRLAEKADARLYWNWVNEKEVRKNAFNDSFIEWGEHIKWFNQSLASSSTTLLIFEKKRVPIGQVRFNNKGVKYWIDYSISKSFRGLGFAVPMMISAIGYLNIIKPALLIAEVKKSNNASIKVFEKMDFIKNETVKNKDNVTFERKINF